MKFSNRSKYYIGSRDQYTIQITAVEYTMHTESMSSGLDALGVHHWGFITEGGIQIFEISQHLRLMAR